MTERPYPAQAAIYAEPANALIDVPVQIVLRHFAPNERVEVSARVEVGPDDVWTASATFISDDSGKIDLARQAPVSGTYEGADATGLIWSLSPTEGGRSDARFIETSLAPYTIQFAAQSESGRTAKTGIVRRPVAESVSRTPVQEGGLVATLFTPAGEGPHPTIIVVPGSGGGIPESLAALYASHGYAALALAYFKAGEPGVIPDQLRNIPLEYFEQAFDWVERHPDLDTSRLIFNGTSRGGELSLLLGSRYPQLTAIISWVPSSHVWGGLGSDPTAEASASWTYQGQPIPFVARSIQATEPTDENGELELTPAFLASLEADPNSDQASIPVEQINGPILLLSGRDDRLWPSAYFSDLVVERLRASNFPHEVTHLAYENAGHTIGPAYSPTTLTSSTHPTRKHRTAYGGTPKGIADARADLWPKVLDFVARHVGRTEAPAAKAAD